MTPAERAQATVARVLAEHEPMVTDVAGEHVRCECGWYGSALAHHEHVAEAVLTALAPAFAEAERRGAREAYRDAARRVRRVTPAPQSSLTFDGGVQRAARILRDLAATHKEDRP